MGNRFYDITLILTFVSLAIGMVNAAGVFDPVTYAEIDGQTWEYSDLETIAANSGGDMGVLDYFSLTVSWLATAFSMVVQMIKNMVYVYPLLTNVFMLPAWMAAFVQGGVVMVYMSFFIQFISRFHWGSVDS